MVVVRSVTTCTRTCPGRACCSCGSKRVMLSATVICDDGALADCLSTALFLMEPEEALEFARSQGVRAILVTLDGPVLDTQEK